jgi:hypothetical protein
MLATLMMLPEPWATDGPAQLLEIEAGDAAGRAAFAGVVHEAVETAMTLDG